ncbi:hypothetical protein B0H65DRAFT_465253 [Neurospora tetraspora]|uniref:Uncharacterized protein n=1 Tax=Neurospora tetraspora TaxID=94610 RepID=A0AAE0JF43_9PEZI|nr:hypothetical protein B0H65DRAFT_465253 [Neurospora tetraspora]
MAHINARTSHRGHPPKKRARIDSDLEESCSVEVSASGDIEEEEDASASASPSTYQKRFSTAENHALSLLSARNHLNNDPLISFSDRDAILALAAARHPNTFGELLQQKYNKAKDHQERNSRIIGFEPYYQEVQTSLCTIPGARDLDPSAFELRTRRMRELYTRVDQIFDLILQSIDLESQRESKYSAARTMQKILRRLLIFSSESGYIIPKEFSSGRGRVGLDGKMLKLIKDKFNHKNHDIKMMMVREYVRGGLDWVERVKELVRLSSRGGEVFKMLAQVLKMVEKNAFDPATDCDSRGMPTF